MSMISSPLSYKNKLGFVSLLVLGSLMMPSSSFGMDLEGWDNNNYNDVEITDSIIQAAMLGPDGAPIYIKSEPIPGNSHAHEPAPGNMPATQEKRKKKQKQSTADNTQAGEEVAPNKKRKRKSATDKAQANASNKKPRNPRKKSKQTTDNTSASSLQSPDSFDSIAPTFSYAPDNTPQGYGIALWCRRWCDPTRL